jgi:glycosyltransferase involved in cell wall biosynthesis
VVLQSTGFSERITEAENFKTIWIDYPALSLRTVFWLQSTLRKEKVQLIHSPYFLTPLGGDFLKVITVHDLMALKFPNFFQGRALPIRIYAKFFTRAFIGSSVNLSSAIITVSNIVREEVIRWKPEYGEKTKVIYQGVDSVFRRVSNAASIERIRSKFGLTQKIILYVGNTRPYKNLPRLIRAFDLVRKEDPSCKLVIGGGESRNLHNLKNLVRTLRLDDNVVFTGSLIDEEIVELMNAADVFVFPSLYEGFGLPPLEAMACGTPVVGSSAGALPEILGDAALLANPRCEEEIYTCIMRVLNDETLRKTLVKKGYQRVMSFSWEKAGRQVLEVYERAFKTRYGA